MSSSNKKTDSNSNNQLITSKELTADESYQTDARELERIEEDKLKAKCPKVLCEPARQSAFLRKRLEKGRKFFDSGDYELEKLKKVAGEKPHSDDKVMTYGTVPTPETVPALKVSMMQPPSKRLSKN